MKPVVLFESQAEAEKALPLNETKKCRYEEVEFCLVRNKKGYFAFESKCPHMSAYMNKAKINGLNEVVCPWHAYRFSLVTGEEAKSRCKDLKVYEVTFEEGKLVVNL